MKICYGSDAPFLGGAERFVELLAKGMLARGHDVSLVMRCADASSPLGGWAQTLSDCGVSVTPVDMNLPYGLTTLGRLRTAFREQVPDVVHLNMPGPYDAQMAVMAPMARRAGARGVVATEHLPMVSPLWKRALVRRWAMRSVDIVTTVCAANVPFLTGQHRVPDSKVRAVHNGLDREHGRAEVDVTAVRRRAGVGDNDVVVLFVGNLLPHKGLLRVLHAMPSISETAHLVVVGDGPDRAHGESLAEKLGIASRVHWQGRLEANEVRDWMLAGDLLTLPSTIEGLPYVIMEAMACGLPVVASNVYGIPEMITAQENGLLVNPNDVAAIAAAIHRLVADATLRVQMGIAARKRFELEFTLETHLDKFESIYREVIGG